MKRNENVGIFRVITDDLTSLVLGTAFAIKSFSFRNKYYLLTAYHVISELEAKQRPIIVQDENGKVFNATKIFPDNLSMKYREFGQDYAMLEIYSNIEYQTFEIAIVEKRLECFVRGAVPHYCTIFSSFDGKILNLESILNQKKVLQINIDTSLHYDDQNKFIPEQKILCGLSGAPVLVEMNGEDVCVGVLGNLERDRRGLFKYAVPMRTIVEECLEPLNISYRLFNENEEGNILFHDEALIELTIGDVEEFLFSEENSEQKAWDKLSDLFYKGIPADSLLANVIKSKNFSVYNAEVKCAILYFYARLLFKRGESNRALEILHDISGMLYGVSLNTRVKLEALINSRSAIERTLVLPYETLNSIRYAGEKIINIPNASDGYVANELASMYGRGLTNLFSLNIEYSRQEREELSKIYREHKSLLEKNPVKLCKQDVVNTSLQWYLGYWDISKEMDLQGLSTAVSNGFVQSKQRRNSIFYIQSFISYGIWCALNGKKVQAVKILLLSVKLMHKEKVCMNHEGIKQLLLILKERCLPLHVIFEMAYKTQMDASFFNKVWLCQMDLGIHSWEGIFRQVNELYMMKFNCNKKIYSVELEDIKFFL